MGERRRSAEIFGRVSVAPPGGNDPDPLTAFQLEVARAFFAMPESEGFLLAGGAALAAHGMTSRPTRDLDLFTSAGTVDAAQEGFEALAQRRGWTIRRIRDTTTFCRLVVSTTDDVVIVDLAVDSPPQVATVTSTAGPTFGPDELAARKTVALFDRAEARDFTDVYTLAQTYSKAQLINAARRIDLGFDTTVFADMLDTLHRFVDDELPTVEPGAVREFFAAWAAELRSPQG